jgi:hypothetical protein
MINNPDLLIEMEIDSKVLKFRDEAGKASLVSIPKIVKIFIGSIFCVIGLLVVDLYFLNVNFDISGLDFSFQSNSAIVNAKANPVISTYFSTAEVS